jgi:hypothetical protein
LGFAPATGRLPGRRPTDASVGMIDPTLLSDATKTGDRKAADLLPLG